MEVTSNILELLKNYSSRQRSPSIEFGEFADYVRHYAQHHVNEKGWLGAFLGTTDDALQDELRKLTSSRHIVISNASQGKQVIFVIPSFIETYSEKYKDIELNIGIPFPNLNDLPKHVPTDAVTKVQAADFLYERLEKESVNGNVLFCLEFDKSIPGLLFPSSLSVSVLLKLTLKKIQDMLRKEEYHDYFLKKLTISNPGKELSMKNFFTLLVARPEEAFDALRSSGDNFYYWSQLCYFVRQDYNKRKDYTSEEINTLQCISILEISTAFFKSRATERTQTENAFKEFDRIISSPPYYFTKSDIEKFKDSNGKSLLGQYSKEALNERLNFMHSETVGNSLPQLLIFRVDEKEGYFIMKDKIMPLIIRLCNEASSVIRDSLSRTWFKSLLEFETLPEMKEQLPFEKCLERELRVAQPILYALLHSSFMPVIAFEDNTPGRITLFRNGLLVPYSELLLVSRQEIYLNAKMKLPVWYSIPVVSWVVSLFVKKPKKGKKAKRQEYQTATESTIVMEKAAAEEKVKQLEAKDKSPRSRAKAFRNIASEAEQKLVPENSTLDRELKAYLGEWNDRLEGSAYDNLTMDVNNLIRDYLRKVLKSLKTENMSEERIESLAISLEESPSLMKIKNHPALRHYIQLYMIKLLKNLPPS